MEDLKNKSIFNLSVDEEANYNLLELAKWARFLGIVGFIFIGLMVVASIVAVIAMSSYSSTMIPTAYLFLIYIVIAGLYFYPIFALHKSGKDIKFGIQNNDQFVFNKGLSFLKNCFKYMGILTIVIISFYAIAAIIGIITSATFS